MQSVPNHRADKAKDVSDHGRHHDKSNRSHWIKWFNEVNRLDHVRPENEIEDGLRPAKQNENRPNEMPSADQRADHQPNLVGISHRYSLYNYAGLPARLRDDKRARNSLGD
jgi:hypothetical protein